jgi:hypothetical protein
MSDNWMQDLNQGYAAGERGATGAINAAVDTEESVMKLQANMKKRDEDQQASQVLQGLMQKYQKPGPDGKPQQQPSKSQMMMELAEEYGKKGLVDQYRKALDDSGKLASQEEQAEARQQAQQENRMEAAYSFLKQLDPAHPEGTAEALNRISDPQVRQALSKFANDFQNLDPRMTPEMRQQMLAKQVEAYTSIKRQEAQTKMAKEAEQEQKDKWQHEYEMGKLVVEGARAQAMVRHDPLAAAEIKDARKEKEDKQAAYKLAQDKYEQTNQDYEKDRSDLLKDYNNAVSTAEKNAIVGDLKRLDDKHVRDNQRLSREVVRTGNLVGANLESKIQGGETKPSAPKSSEGSPSQAQINEAKANPQFKDSFMKHFNLSEDQYKKMTGGTEGKPKEVKGKSEMIPGTLKPTHGRGNAIIGYTYKQKTKTGTKSVDVSVKEAKEQGLID